MSLDARIHHATYSATQKRLLKGEQGFIYGEDIIFCPLNKIFHDYICLAAMGQRVTSSSDEILSFIKIQLQGYRKGQGR